MLLFLVYLYAEAFSILYLCASLAGACDDGPRRRAAAFFIISSCNNQATAADFLKLNLIKGAAQHKVSPERSLLPNVCWFNNKS